MPMNSSRSAVPSLQTVSHRDHSEPGSRRRGTSNSPCSVRQGSARLAGIFSGDQPNHQFIFELTSESPVYESYTVSDASPPFFAQKRIDLARSVADYTSTPRPYALV